MNAKQKKFITEKLIPFVLREQGRGFGMSVWQDEAPEGFKKRVDGVWREVPKCNTVACIGGSISALTDLFRDESESIGLTKEEGNGLFYGWNKKRGVTYMEDENRYGWPLSFQTRYSKAKTTLGKAKVAVALLKEVVKTNGKCLHRKAAQSE